MHQSLNDPCLYTHRDGAVLVHVDDMAATGTEAELTRLVNMLCSAFALTAEPLHCMHAWYQDRTQ